VILADFYHKSLDKTLQLSSDGSKDSEGAIGAAVFSPKIEGNIKHRLPSETSIFSAELWTIYQVIQVINDLDLLKSVIFSDSESALKALQNSSKVQYNYIIYCIKRAYLGSWKKRGEKLHFSGFPHRHTW